MAQQQQQGGMDITQLNLQQLDMLRQQLDEEIQILTSSYQQLKVASSRFVESKEALNAIDPKNAGQDLMIPFTSSLFVPAKLASADSVLVDVGTGYFVKKSVKDAKDFCDRKVKLIHENSDQVAQALNVKKKNMETVIYVMQSKIEQQQQQQGPQQ